MTDSAPRSRLRGDSGTPAQSPVLRQYLEAKGEHPDAILLFRLGDFYETFQEDAEVAAGLLGITLTSRDFGRAGRHPMAGFPAHAAEGYIARLLAGGQRVAICDQMEDAAGATGHNPPEQSPRGPRLVRREVVRVLTPGTLVEAQLLEPGRENPLLAIARAGEVFGLAAVEVSTGRLELSEVPARPGALEEILNRLAPSELLVADEEDGETATPEGWSVARLEPWRFEAERGRRRALEALRVRSLRGFDCDDLGPALGALGAALDYLQRNRVSLPPEVIRLRRSRPGGAMHLDAATVANLELVQGLGGTGRGLLGLLDRTRTPMGARCLRAWLLAPLLEVAAIDRRAGAVAELVERPELREGLEGCLRRVRDLERLTTRTAQGHAAPRDLGAIRESLPALDDLRAALAGASAHALVAARERVEPEAELQALLAGALEDSPPAAAADGGAIRAGFDPRLDALRGGIQEAQAWIAGLEARERAATGVRGLKVGFNRVFGYYIEVGNANRLPLPEHYQRKQTLAGAERYITPELKERESVVLNGEQAILAREREVLADLARAVAARAPTLLRGAEAVGELDALAALAAVAVERGWVRAEVDGGYGLAIRGGRHPLVEAALPAGTFVPNDTLLDAGTRLMLLTGPNMAGKSTYLRQVGLLVLMAQVGSFIPADAARIGVADRIFTRVGAQDAIAQGLSTFMVEMVETANILNHAGPRSLVVIDEIGRGTSTYDGMSIAQAVLEHLHDAPGLRPQESGFVGAPGGCRTLFATHFHELTALSRRLPGLANHRVEVSEAGGGVTFLHRIVTGGADRSYGIHVAEIAGLPAALTARAREILAGLERARPLAEPTAAAAEAQLALPIEVEHPVVRELAGLDIETMSPLEALNRLARLKALGAEPARG
ncbi:MAG TPA: DNA mismatch repair protein MutS [Candidatus Dormibacteraeota bacterium]|nr:DNA mismatch repair protein MutS [Candidatus Dormibacteraeota bacterium]